MNGWNVPDMFETIRIQGYNNPDDPERDVYGGDPVVADATAVLDKNGLIQVTTNPTNVPFERHNALIAQRETVIAEKDALIAEKQEVIAKQDDEIVVLKNDRKHANEMKNTYINALNSYKTQVRDAIIEAHEADEITDEAASELLETLGLEGILRTYTVTVTLTRTEEVEIEATDEDDAYEKIQEKGAYDLFNDDFGGCADYFDVEVQHVSVQ